MNSLLKKETSGKVYRVFKNRFSTYLLQEKPKNLKGNWTIINGFAHKKTALNILNGLLKQNKHVKSLMIPAKELGLLKKNRLLHEFQKLRSRGIHVTIR